MRRTAWGRRAIGATVGAVGIAIALSFAPAASAVPTATTTQDIDFDGYALGSPVGQNGWSGGSGTDYAVVQNSAFAGGAALTGTQSLRYSNAVVAGFDQLWSPPVDFVGEPSGTAGYNTFSGGFTVASATGALQPGLDLDVAASHGSNRAGGIINLLHVAGGLQIGTYWFPVGGTDVNDVSQWRSQILATVDPSVPHRIDFRSVFDDAGVDLFTISVDGTAVGTVPTWENYFQVRDGNSDDQVNGLIIRPGNSTPTADGIGYTTAPAQPTLAGKGFLLSGIGYAASNSAPPLPTSVPALDPAPTTTPDAPLPLPKDSFAPGESVTVTVGGFAPFDDVYFTWYSTPIFAGWFQADLNGNLTATLSVPASLDPGQQHTLQATSLSGRVVNSALSISALAETGIDAGPIVAAALSLLVLGGAATLLARRRRAIGTPRD